MTTDLPTLKALQTRIREAKGADTRLDDAIAKVFGWPHGPVEFVEDRTIISTEQQADIFTTDPEGLGACVQLMRETLPGCERSRDEYGRYRIWGPPSLTQKRDCLSASTILANDCLTFLDAIVAAMIAQMEARESVS